MLWVSKHTSQPLSPRWRLSCLDVIQNPKRSSTCAQNLHTLNIHGQVITFFCFKWPERLNPTISFVSALFVAPSSAPSSASPSASPAAATTPAPCLLIPENHPAIQKNEQTTTRPAWNSNELKSNELKSDELKINDHKSNDLKSKEPKDAEPLCSFEVPVTHKVKSQVEISTITEQDASETLDFHRRVFASVGGVAWLLDLYKTGPMWRHCIVITNFRKGLVVTLENMPIDADPILVHYIKTYDVHIQIPVFVRSRIHNVPSCAAIFLLNTIVL